MTLASPSAALASPSTTLATPPAVLASSSADLVSPSAALALMSMVRFQFTTVGKLLVGAVQPLVHLHHSAALRDLNAAAFRFLLSARLQCSCKVQPSATLALTSTALLQTTETAGLLQGAVSQEQHSEFIAVLAQYTCDVQSAFLQTTEAELVFLPSFQFGQGGKFTLENQSSNRARHFKNRGTLRKVKVKK